jgi:glycerol uptake facilitator-like aquaporin
MEYFSHTLVCALYEFIGNFVLIFAINASMGNHMGVGFTYLFLGLLFGPITGAHFNPAVSLGVWINKEKTWHTFYQLMSFTTA